MYYLEKNQLKIVTNNILIGKYQIYTYSDSDEQSGYCIYTSNKLRNFINRAKLSTTEVIFKKIKERNPSYVRTLSAEIQIYI